MRNPFFVARLGAFTISLLLFLGSAEGGYGIDAGWGWFLALFLLTMVTGWDLLSFVACCLSFLLLTGILDESRAAFIVLTIFTGIALVNPRGPAGAARLGYRVWTWRTGGSWGDRTYYR
jgi:hypothetical protein